MVYKSVGFNFDKILAGFSAMGHTYLEIQSNFSMRLFHWIFDLFDHKIVPNVPNPPKSGGTSIWTPSDKSYNNPILNTIKNPDLSLREGYKSIFSVNIEPTPWYKERSTWLWLICGLGLAYCVYKFIMDPLFLDNFKSTNNSTIPTNNPINPDIELNDERINPISPIKKIISVYYTVINKLNPINYFTSSTETKNTFNIFMEKQYNPVTADVRYYPFTEINPYIPWYKQFKISYIGESVIESLQRFKDRTIADQMYNSISISKGKYVNVEGITPSLVATPNNWVGSVGLGTSTPSNLVDTLQYLNIENRFRSLTPVPTVIPDLPSNIINDVMEWKTHEKSSIIDDSLKASSSKLILDDIPIHKNRFDVLKGLDNYYPHCNIEGLKVSFEGQYS